MAINYITKPFQRVMRPNLGGSWLGDYIYDRRYSDSWSSSIRALELIINDFKKLCEFVDPRDENLTTHSHRIYELYFRACSEFESNARAILQANDYKRYNKKGKLIDPKYWNITDYTQLNESCALDKYVVHFPFWNDGSGLDVKPFRNLGSGRSGVLVWYSTYSALKHERGARFFDASLENLVYAMSALIAILFAQYGVQVFDPYQRIGSWESEDEQVYKSGSIFGVKPPTFEKKDCYNLDWSKLCQIKDPFTQLAL